MSKHVIMAVGSAVAIVGAATYYVSPVRSSDPDVPAIKTDRSPEEVKSELRKLSFESFRKQIESHGSQNDFMTSKFKPVSDSQVEYDIAVGSGDLIRVAVMLEPASGGGTIIDIKPEIIGAAFKNSSELHPYDLTAMTAMVDVLATEYIASVIERRRMAGESELQGLLIKHVGFDKDQWRSFGQRVQSAYAVSFGAALKNKASNGGWGSSAGEYPGYGVSGKPDVDPDAAVQAAEYAAEAAARSAAQGR